MRWMVLLLLLGAALAKSTAVAAQAGDGQAMYRYKNAGRVVYTNIVEQVPLEQRARAYVDLSRVELNTEVGNELERHLQEQHAALTKSPYCQRLIAAANTSFLVRLWNDYAPLLGCGGILLVLLIVTPTALRNYGAPAWAKVLSIAIPGLGVAALMMFSMTYTTKTMSMLKQQAQPCAAETFARFAGRKDAISQHMQLVEQLKQRIAKIDRVVEGAL